jgi:uncharacterized damage-inducible protein DinB
MGFRSTTVMSQALSAWAEIDAARKYTYGLLEAFDERQWFRQPNEGVTHIAWQVGHLAIAQYSLALSRLRGVQLGDDAILPASYEALFSRTTVPDPDATKYPAPAEIRATLDRVHVRVRDEVSKYSDAELAAAAIGKPHPVFMTKLGALVWCARHEMIHAGQIGLLKRLLGAPPRW